MRKLSLPAVEVRTLPTTVADLRPPRPAAAVSPDRLDPTVSRPPRRAPLISLLGVDIDLATLKEKIRKNLVVVGDSALISLIINATSGAFTYFSMGIPFDLKIAAAYMVIGTAIGSTYFPVKQAISKRMSQPTAPPLNPLRQI